MVRFILNFICLIRSVCISRITSTMCVLVFPILIQKELLQVAEQISREQRSLLLGPQAATGAFSGGAF